jgi:hypothetical protein
LTTRLQELGFTDFTGGLNVRDNRSFQIANNESPQMLNMRADERLGIYTRQGMGRWNGTAITSDPWNPRMGVEHDYSDDTKAIFVTNAQRIWVANNTTTFVEMGYPAPSTNPVKCNAEPHLADFASWGDVVYIATGRKVDALLSGDTPVRYNKDGTVTALTPTGLGDYNDDYTIPVGGVMPQCDFAHPHAGYLFCASIREDYDGSVKDYPSRLRWSHPNSPEDWATLDFLDIEVGGGRITGLVSFRDHLLIFKTDSIWALYGYDSESWQLVRVSNSIGIPSPTAVASSPFGAFFYSASGRGDIYLYQGGEPQRISERIEEPVESIAANRYIDVFLGWASDRLMVALPWIAEWDPTGGSSSSGSSLFTWDPHSGEAGAWEMHRPAKGNIGPIIERSDSRTEPSLLVLYGSDVDPCLLQFASIDGAYDFIDDQATPIPFPTLYATNWKFADSPELRKHWMRPRFIIRIPPADFTLRVEVYRDYDESEPKRTFQLFISAEGEYYWRDLGFDDPSGTGFDWEPTSPSGRGGLWSGAARGGRIIRGKSFGIARSVQLVFSTSPSSIGQQWGLDAVVLKHIDRRFTT